MSATAVRFSRDSPDQGTLAVILPPGMRLIASPDSYSVAFTHSRRRFAIHGGRPNNCGRCGRDLHPRDNADHDGR
jgi:hypothetical protein